MCVCVCVCRGKSNHTSPWSPTGSTHHRVGQRDWYYGKMRHAVHVLTLSVFCLSNIVVALQWCCEPSVLIAYLLQIIALEAKQNGFKTESESE